MPQTQGTNQLTCIYVSPMKPGKSSSFSKEEGGTPVPRGVNLYGTAPQGSSLQHLTLDWNLHQPSPDPTNNQ